MSSPVQQRSLAAAKANFAECVREAEAGNTVLLTRHGRPVARLGPIDPSCQSDSVTEPAVQYGTPSSAQIAEEGSEFRAADAREVELLQFLSEELWPQIPQEMLGRAPTKKQREKILGYGRDGV